MPGGLKRYQGGRETLAGRVFEPMEGAFSSVDVRLDRNCAEECSYEEGWGTCCHPPSGCVGILLLVGLEWIKGGLVGASGSVQARVVIRLFAPSEMKSGSLASKGSSPH